MCFVLAKRGPAPREAGGAKTGSKARARASRCRIFPEFFPKIFADAKWQNQMEEKFAFWQPFSGGQCVERVLGNFILRTACARCKVALKWAAVPVTICCMIDDRVQTFSDMARKMDVARIAAFAAASNTAEAGSQSRAEAVMDRTPSTALSDPRKTWSLAHALRLLVRRKRNETAL